MNFNHNIIVLGISGNVSFGILRVLRKNFPKSKIIGCCVNDTYNKIFCDKFVKSPLAESEEFIPWLLKICSDEKINIVFSGVEEVIWKISNHKDYIESFTDCVFTFSDTDKLFIGNNKYETVKWLKNNNLNYPRFIIPRSINDLINFYEDIKGPLILKPIKGKGSKGIKIIKSLDTINNLQNNLSNMICQEMIGNNDSEYTIGCYQNMSGEIMEPIILKRELYNGHTIFAEIEDNFKIKNYALKIMKKFNPYGPLNIQLRLDKKGDPICFELNVRFSGTTLIRDYYGFKDVVSIFREKLEGSFSKQDFQIRENGKFIRFNDEFFFDSNNFDLNSISHYE